MTALAEATLDTSIWIPYLRTRRYAATVDSLVAAGRVWVSTVALLELYAGTRSRDDELAVDDLAGAARRMGRVVYPSEMDFKLAGQILAYHGRHHGSLRPRDHSHDLLIAISGARTGSVLFTENLKDMRRWSEALARRAGLRVRVLCPPV